MLIVFTLGEVASGAIRLVEYVGKGDGLVLRSSGVMRSSAARAALREALAL